LDEPEILTRSRNALLPLLLVAATVVAYLPALSAGFVWDDDSHVTDNQCLRSLDGLRRIWLEPGATPQYYPLTHTSFWLEYRLWGSRPFGYHLNNILLHALNAVLIVLLLRRLGVPGAWLAGLLFALHPVHAESVAWVSERKNVLSGAFYLAAALAFLRYAPPSGEDGKRGPKRYHLLFLGLFLAALLSKTVTATLPAALLLVLYWCRGRVTRRDLPPLLLPFGLAVAAGSVTVWMEAHHVGAVGESWDLGVVERVLISGRALWFYLGTLAWPVDLTFIYPRWEVDSGAIWQFLYPAAVLVSLAVLVLARHRIGRGPVVAALYFAGTLVPALGFFNVYPFRFSFVADHFQYLASIGPLAVAGAVGVGILSRWPWAGTVLGCVLLSTMGFLSWQRAQAFADEETLWRDTLASNPAAWMAHLNLGALLDRSNRVEEAYRHYALALQGKPDLAGGWSNLGAAAQRLGRPAEALDHFATALRLDPGHVDATMNRANALFAAGRIDEAAAGYRRVVELRSDHAGARNNLGVLLLAQGDAAGAAEQLEAAVAARPGFVRAWITLGEAREQQGRPVDAAAAYRRALELEPGQRDAAGALARLAGGR
jgi:Tfp pilus assembly protein PilF